MSEYLPDVYIDFREAYPEVAEALDAWERLPGTPGPWTNGRSGSSSWGSSSADWPKGGPVERSQSP